MTATYITNHAAIENALTSWAETYSGLSGKVRWKDQVVGRPAKPYVTLALLVSGLPSGIDAELGHYNGTTSSIDTVTFGDRRLTLQVEVYDAPPDATLNTAMVTALRRLLGMQASLRTPAVKAAFQAAGVSYRQCLLHPQAGPNADEQLGERWEHRAIMDLEFGYTAAFTDIKDISGGGTNWIDTLEAPLITVED